MAEQEPTAEQLAQIAAENEEDEHSVNYKPPAQKSIQEIQELDKDDESLRKYKEALLGRVAVSSGERAGGRPPCPQLPLGAAARVLELGAPGGGALTCCHSTDPNVPNVVVTRLTLVCSSAPGPLELDLTGGWPRRPDALLFPLKTVSGELAPSRGQHMKCGQVVLEGAGLGFGEA